MSQSIREFNNMIRNTLYGNGYFDNYYVSGSYASGSSYITTSSPLHFNTGLVIKTEILEDEIIRKIEIEGIPTITCEYCGNIYNRKLFVETQMHFACFTCGARLKDV